MNKNLKIYRQCHDKCETCGDPKDLLVHHIDEDRSNNTFDNFRVLCTSCHAKVHTRIKNMHKMRSYYINDINQLTFRF